MPSISPVSPYSPSDFVVHVVPRPPRHVPDGKSSSPSKIPRDQQPYGLPPQLVKLYTSTVQGIKKAIKEPAATAAEGASGRSRRNSRTRITPAGAPNDETLTLTEHLTQAKAQVNTLQYEKRQLSAKLQKTEQELKRMDRQCEELMLVNTLTATTKDRMGFINKGGTIVGDKTITNLRTAVRHHEKRIKELEKELAGAKQSARYKNLLAREDECKALFQETLRLQRLLHRYESMSDDEEDETSEDVPYQGDNMAQEHSMKFKRVRKSLREELEKALKECENFKKELAKSHGENRRLRDEGALLTNQTKHLQADLSKSLEGNSKTTAELTRANDELGTLRKAYAALEADSTKSQTALEEIKKDATELRTNVETLRADIMKKEEEMKSLVVKNETTEAELKKKAAECDEITITRSQLEEKYKTLQTEVTGLNSVCDGLRNEVQRLKGTEERERGESLVLKKLLQDSESRSADIATALSNAQKEILELKQKIQDSESLLTKSTAEKDSLQNEVAAFRLTLSSELKLTISKVRADLEQQSQSASVVKAPIPPAPVMPPELTLAISKPSTDVEQSFQSPHVDDPPDISRPTILTELKLAMSKARSSVEQHIQYPLGVPAPNPVGPTTPSDVKSPMSTSVTDVEHVEQRSQPPPQIETQTTTAPTMLAELKMALAKARSGVEQHFQQPSADAPPPLVAPSSSSSQSFLSELKLTMSKFHMGQEQQTQPLAIVEAPIAAAPETTLQVSLSPIPAQMSISEEDAERTPTAKNSRGIFSRKGSAEFSQSDSRDKNEAPAKPVDSTSVNTAQESKAQISQPDGTSPAATTEDHESSRNEEVTSPTASAETQPPSNVDKSATKIQSVVRGFMARREHQKRIEAWRQEESRRYQAAQRIQAVTRGRLVRRRRARAIEIDLQKQQATKPPSATPDTPAEDPPLSPNQETHEDLRISPSSTRSPSVASTDDFEDSTDSGADSEDDEEDDDDDDDDNDEGDSDEFAHRSDGDEGDQD
ncbi:hypothetical protein HDU85_006011 [Gaertneriomyces sp. JEL0708]|nr:hypothetical protein HDU85_006011 [Gaertneriomyces sp. JEL0708]